MNEDKPLGSCCQRLAEELSKSYDYPYLFERDGMLAITAGFNKATETQREHFVRAFARHCPFCGTWIMPEAARKPSN